MQKEKAQKGEWNMSHDTREAWLSAALAAFREGLFVPKGFATPKEIKVSVGYPRGKKCLQSGSHELDKAGKTQIFINPSIDRPAFALEVLCKQVICASGGDSGHWFKKLGFNETSPKTWEPSQDLYENLRLLAEELGPFPHDGIEVKAAKPQSGRLGKLACKRGCGAIVYLTKKAMEAARHIQCDCGAMVLESAPWL